MDGAGYAGLDLESRIIESKIFPDALSKMTFYFMIPNHPPKSNFREDKFAR